MTRAVRVGLIADTHGLLRPAIAEYFAGVDLIVHAGDVGATSVLEALSSIAPVEAVYGNVDDPCDPRLARERTIPVGGLTLHVSHGHELGSPTPALLVARYKADIVVFGHTHRALVTTIARGATSALVINPGAAGPRRFSLKASLAVLTVVGGTASVDIKEL